MIEAEGLAKRYGQTVALAGIDLQVPAGSILGVLGPNGAGKTTAVRILTTLSRPDSGWARVAGHDVVREAAAVQRNIGVTAQDATVDEVLTGRQNLVMIGRLSGLRRREARARATELLDQADELADGIVVIDHGHVIARGTPAELKAEIGGARLEVTLSEANPAASGALEPFVAGAVHLSQDGRRLRAPVRSGGGLASTVVRALDAAGITVDDVEVRQPSLDDVFFALTGRPAEMPAEMTGNSDEPD